MSLGNVMTFVMFIGAARADATPEQLVRLRGEVLPLLEEFRRDGDAKPVLTKVTEIMGPHWQPTGEWREWIDKLMKDSG